MDKAAFRRRLQPRVAKLRAAVACFVGEAIDRRTVGQLGQHFTFQVGTGAQVGMAVRVGHHGQAFRLRRNTQKGDK